MSGLCVNCMAYGDVRSVEVGQEKGSQRDPYREQLLLCGTCAAALTSGQLSTFHDRFANDNLITRDVIEDTR